MKYGFIFKVKVKQDLDSLEFEFNKDVDAFEFASTCIEAGAPETEITIVKAEVKED